MSRRLLLSGPAGALQPIIVLVAWQPTVCFLNAGLTQSLRCVVHCSAFLFHCTRKGFASQRRVFGGRTCAFGAGVEMWRCQSEVAGFSAAHQRRSVPASVSHSYDSQWAGARPRLCVCGFCFHTSRGQCSGKSTRFGVLAWRFLLQRVFRRARVAAPPSLWRGVANVCEGPLPVAAVSNSGAQKMFLTLARPQQMSQQYGQPWPAPSA